MALAPQPTTVLHDSVDLIALGKTWTPPKHNDTSPEVLEVIAKMPWWATRSLLYIIVTFIIVASRVGECLEGGHGCGRSGHTYTRGLR